jgi:RNA polymerase sigma factor (sigma-70 family)
MAKTSLTGVVQHIRTLMSPPGSDQVPDGQLLQRFTDHHDEAAFTTLVRRHGALVLSVCQGVLGQVQDAEDAFQATFLLLARKAATIRRHETLASWLYKVAFRLALKARASAASRRCHEARALDRVPSRRLDDLTWREAQRVLYEELNGLPEKLRAPLVLHYLEGQTQDETARQLGWPRGTLKGRLERARDLLRRRLTRRGLAPGMALLAAGLSQQTAAALPAALVRAAVHTALPSTAGGCGFLSPRVAQLAYEGFPTMTGIKLKVAIALVLAVSLAATALGLWAGEQGQAGRNFQAGAGAGAPPPGAAKQDRPASSPQPAQPDKGRRIVLTGHVRGADGQPVANAQVALIVRPKRPTLNDQDQVLGQTRADAEGRYRLTVPLGAAAYFWEVTVLAGAKGHGLAVQQLSPDVQKAQADIKLPVEQVLRGRLVDVQGQPAAHVKVYLTRVGGMSGGMPVGVHLTDPPKDFPLWPGPVTTDAQGRFLLTGMNQDGGMGLEVRDDRFARQHLYPGKVRNQAGKEIRISLAPAQWLEGRVLAEDTGKPVPHARLAVGGADSERQVRFVGIQGRGQADGQGRFRINLPPGKWFNVTASAPVGQPYLTPRQTFEWPRGAVKHARDIKLPRGVLVRGKITEAASGQPVAGAGVQYEPCPGQNPKVRTDVLRGWQDMVVSGADGVFQIVVQPGPGHLLISGPTQEFIHQEIGSNIISAGRPGGLRYYPDGLVKLDLPAKSGTKEVAVTLRRGVTVEGRLLGPDGKPVARALLFHRLHVAGFDLMWRFPVKVSDARFAVQGCDPKGTYPVYFLDPQNQWGATVTISGKQAGQPVTVRLARCGRAQARFLDPEGKPLKSSRLRLSPTMIITPGRRRFDDRAAGRDALLADEDLVANLDRLNYWDGLRTDEQGRCIFPALIPGATYRFSWAGKDGKVVRKEFTVKAGQTLELGDITWATRQ